jgi:hypothetical protein
MTTMEKCRGPHQDFEKLLSGLPNTVKWPSCNQQVLKMVSGKNKRANEAASVNGPQWDSVMLDIVFAFEQCIDWQVLTSRYPKL